MKHLQLLALFLISFTCFSQEKTTDVGLKLGGSYTFTSGTLKETFGNGQVRFNAGIYTRENMGPVNIVFEGYYNNIAVSKKDFNFNLHTLNFPLLLESAGDIPVSAHIGVSPSFIVGSKIKVLEQQIKPELRQVNIDLALGFGIKLSEEIRLIGRAHIPTIHTPDYKPTFATLSINCRLANLD